MEKLYYDSIGTKFGILYLLFEDDFSLVSVFLPSKNKKNKYFFLEFLHSKKLNNYSLSKNSYPKKNIFKEYFHGEKISFSEINFNIDFFKPTDFQKLVWSECMKIQYAETRTYNELANLISIKFPLVLGSALGKNPLSLLIPCHRVVAKNSIGGFSADGGVLMKKALIDLEKA